MHTLPRFYDPESQTHVENTTRLLDLYKELYPWDGTDKAKYYDYPSFANAVTDWADDNFYAQHLTAKLYLDAEEWLNS